MKNKAVFLSIGIITALLTLVGCGGNNIGENLDTTGISVGRLVISITDAPSAPEIDRVMLTITGLSVHIAGTEDAEEEQNADNGSWEELELVGADDGKVTFDLLELQSGLQKDLAIADLGIGKYTQIRMEVESVELDFEGTADDQDLTDAKLPSGKLKFIQPFELIAGQTTELLFDFDALKSVHQNGNGSWICKPVIKLDVVSQPIAEALVITTASMPNGEIGISYTPPALIAVVAIGDLTWSLAEGSVLPNGLTLSTTGIISGTPAISGSFTFVVKVTDNGTFPNNEATKTFTIIIYDVLNITTTSLPDGVKNTLYTGFQLVAVGGSGVYTWSIEAPSLLLAGLSLSSAGIISGIPTADPATYTFNVRVTDTSDPVQTDVQLITMIIN
jgi:hypothetical protein